MGKSSKDLSDSVTVLVFKDNYAARTFQVPLAWLNRFGLLLLVFFLFTLLSVVLAGRFYRISQLADVGHLRQLESEIEELQLALRQADIKPGAVEASSRQDPLAEQYPPGLSPAAPGEPRVSEVPQRPYVFAALPPDAPLAPSPARIAISALTSEWSGRQLEVTFNIQYQGPERGSQQGRIIVLARGPGNLLAYPEGALNAVGSESLIKPEGGEYFSVSRFRAVRAQFGPVQSPQAFNEAEIFLVSDSGQLILHDRVALAPPRKPAQPAQAPSEETAP